MNISEYLYENVKPLVIEGGASGHMKHIIDYDELTLDNIKGIIYSLFSGRIEKMTEKIDGTNIQASMNNAGEVIFIRNNGDLQSERGGMSIEDMVNKWAGKDKIQRTFVESGKTLEQVFLKLGPKFFNPDPETRIFLNCECLIEGTTNIMPYISSKVSVHDMWIYKNVDGKWEHTETTKDGLSKVESAMEDIDGAQITPEIIISVTEEGTRIRNSYFKELNKLFKDAGLRNKNTIEDYKKYRIDRWISDNASWINSNEIGKMSIYDRYFHGVKSGNSSMRSIKSLYPDNVDDIQWLDTTGYKDMLKYATEELDIIFLRLGNDVINLCQGFINDAGKDSVIDELERNLKEVVSEIENDPDTKESSKTKLLNQLNRLNTIGNKINATEGIVFTYRGRLMKCTGSFAPLNQILGSLKYNR